MIGRMWRARAATPSGADSYQELFRTAVLAELGGVAGFRGAYLLRRDTELVTLTLFDSVEAVRGFSGADGDEAHVSAAARAVLSEVGERVDHFEVVAHSPRDG